MMECQNECGSCGCGNYDEELSQGKLEEKLRRLNEAIEQKKHERDLLRLLFWSAVVLPGIPLFFRNVVFVGGNWHSC